MIYSYLDTRIGDLLVAGENGNLVQLSFAKEGKRHPVEPTWREDRAAMRPALTQLEEYFAGRRREFSVGLELRGTPFQKRVWSELLRIPYAETISYGELARRVGNPKASRAVGAANGKNPIAIIVPCHRVIGSDGKLTGFGGGLPVKEELLRHERVHSESQAAY